MSISLAQFEELTAEGQIKIRHTTEFVMSTMIDILLAGYDIRSFID